MDQHVAYNQCRVIMDQHRLMTWRFKFARGKSLLGNCNYGLKRITLSKYFVYLNEWNEVKDVILHEIAHALVGPGHGHNHVWRNKCREIGARPERINYRANVPEGNVIAVCPVCGMTFRRYRMPHRDWYHTRCKALLTWQRT